MNGTLLNLNYGVAFFESFILVGHLVAVVATWGFHRFEKVLLAQVRLRVAVGGIFLLVRLEGLEALFFKF